jgi:MraZ protein
VVETEANAPPLEPPRGIYPARLDDKGRLKLPVPFQQYLGAFPEKKLFVTSFDRRIARVYPISLWREIEKFFENHIDNPQEAENLLFNAYDTGADSEVDSQGRVLFPPELRRELGIENQSVRIIAAKGRIEVFSEAIYQERRRQASATAPADLKVLERAGLR